MDYRPDEKFIRTDVFTEFGQFFVSTIYRETSAALNPGGMFYETFAWKIDPVTGIREPKIIADNSGALFPKRAIENHYAVVEQLVEKGEYKEIEID